MYPPVFEHGHTLSAATSEAFERARAAHTLELPVLPEAASLIMTETERGDWSASRIVDALRRDAAMAAHLLRLSNSVAFSGASRVVSLQQAVARLGGSTLRQVALVIACESKADVASAFAAELKVLFRHSLTVALFARAIARQRRTNVEEAFLAGLLHDMGWAVALGTLAKLEPEGDRSAVLELATSLHHALGAEVARAWKLPEQVAIAIAEHHHAAPVGLAATVALADALARSADDDAATIAQALQPLAATRALNLYPDVLETVARERPAIVAEVASW